MTLKPIVNTALVLTMSCLQFAASAAQTPAPDFDAVVARLETAALASDVAVVKDARLACLRMLAGSGVSADRVAQLRYTVAYAGWRLAFVPTMAVRERVDLLTDAQTQLETVIAANPRNAEALGLLSAVYGAQIANNPDLGMALGPASGEMIGRALALEPLNPRLLVLRGQSQFHTPPSTAAAFETPKQPHGRRCSDSSRNRRRSRGPTGAGSMRMSCSARCLPSGATTQARARPTTPR